MKTKTRILLALALGLASLNLIAQDAPRPERPPRDGATPGGGPGGDGGPMFRRVVSPLENALDADHDGTISADEIANASAALKKLDKNGDGKLTAEEVRPMRPRPGGAAGTDGGNPPGRPGDGPNQAPRPPRPPKPPGE